MTRLFLIRHGQVLPEYQGRLVGLSDVPCSDEGLRQYESLRDHFRHEPVAAVYTSDRMRCQSGADLIAQPHGLRAVAWPTLRELHFGAWEGKSMAEVTLAFPDQVRAWMSDPAHFTLPEGENMLALRDRVRTARDEMQAKHPNETVLVVTHGGVIRTLLLDALGAPLDRHFSLEARYGTYALIHLYADAVEVVHALNCLPLRWEGNHGE